MPVPEVMRARIFKEMQLSPDTPLKFKPKKWVAYPTHQGVEKMVPKFGMVVGEVWLPDWQCEWDAICHNMQETAVTIRDFSVWDVMPYCLTAQANKEDDYDPIMVRILRYFPEDTTFGPNKTPMRKRKEIPEPDAEDEPAAGAAVLGPFGRLCSTLEWESYTRGGCAECSTNLHIVDHRRIEWVGDAHPNPICPDCVEARKTHLTQEILH